MTQPKREPDAIDKIVEDLFKTRPTAHLEEHHFTEPTPITCKWCGSDDTIAEAAKVVRPVNNWTELVRKVGLK